MIAHNVDQLHLTWFCTDKWTTWRESC